MAKGSKRNRWLKDGMRESKKYMKKVWNRKVRNTNDIPQNSNYKKLAKDSAYISVT